METVAPPQTPAEPLTRSQGLTFLTLTVPWLVLLALTLLNPQFLGMFLLARSGIACVVAYVLLTVAQGWLMLRAFRRINAARRRHGGHTTSVLLIFAAATLGALELLAVVFAPVIWARLVAPGT